MRAVAASTVASANTTYRSSYEDDYRQSEAVARKTFAPKPLADVQAAVAEIRDRVAISEETLHDIYTSVLDGKHILLYGPPGTGKTTLAEMIGRSFFDCATITATAVSDWTTFDTIGGLRLTAREGKEYLEPVAGVIVNAIVACLDAIGRRELTGTGDMAAWLVLDELNRANTDAMFGPLFTALDQAHPEIQLPFFDEPRQRLWVPKRFRIIGTMNSFDKNFLHRLSYALTRRFALIPIDVPATDAERAQEKEKLWANVAGSLPDIEGARRMADDLKASYDTSSMTPLSDPLVAHIRARPEGVPGGLGRPIGFAQIADALRHAILQCELGLVGAGDEIKALDSGVRAAIVPQLEGLANATLRPFHAWWKEKDGIKGMARSLQAVGDLMGGGGLYRTE